MRDSAHPGSGRRRNLSITARRAMGSTPAAIVSISAITKSAITPPRASITTLTRATFQRSFPGIGTTPTGPISKTIIRSRPKVSNPTTAKFLSTWAGVDSIPAAYQRIPRRFQSRSRLFQHVADFGPTWSPACFSAIRSANFCRKAAIPIPSRSQMTRLVSTATTLSSSAPTCSGYASRPLTISASCPPIRLAWATASPPLPPTIFPASAKPISPIANQLLATLGGYIDGYSQTSTSPAVPRVSCPACPICAISASPTSTFTFRTMEISSPPHRHLGIRWDIPASSMKPIRSKFYPVIQHTISPDAAFERHRQFRRLFSRSPVPPTTIMISPPISASHGTSSVTAKPPPRGLLHLLRQRCQYSRTREHDREANDGMQGLLRSIRAFPTASPPNLPPIVASRISKSPPPSRQICA